MDNKKRLIEHQKPEELEELLKYFENLFNPLEEKEISDIDLCDEPILYIMGCARSGSTLVYQYLTESGLFTYPTNFISRFYYAPYLGAKLQQMLIEYDFREEIFTKNKTSLFTSNLGKTKGVMSPHEFWYFWRRFFIFGDIQKLSPEVIKDVNTDKFIKDLRAFQSVKKITLSFERNDFKLAYTFIIKFI